MTSLWAYKSWALHNMKIDEDDWPRNLFPFIFSQIIKVNKPLSVTDLQQWWVKLLRDGYTRQAWQKYHKVVTDPSHSEVAGHNDIGFPAIGDGVQRQQEDKVSGFSSMKKIPSHCLGHRRLAILELGKSDCMGFSNLVDWVVGTADRLYWSCDCTGVGLFGCCDCTSVGFFG